MRHRGKARTMRGASLGGNKITGAVTRGSRSPLQKLPALATMPGPQKMINVFLHRRWFHRRRDLPPMYLTGVQYQ